MLYAQPSGLEAKVSTRHSSLNINNMEKKILENIGNNNRNVLIKMVLL